MSFLALAKSAPTPAADGPTTEADTDGNSRTMDTVTYINTKWFSKSEYGFKTSTQNNVFAFL